MTVKELRSGTFLRCYNNDTISIGMSVAFPTNGLMEPYIEISMDNVLGLPINRLNENYNIMKGTFSEPLTNNQNPIKFSIAYTCFVDEVRVNVVHNITNRIAIGNNRISLLDGYTDSGETLRSIIGESTCIINANLKLSGHLKKLPQVQLPYLDIVINKNPYFSNITVIS